MASSSTSGTHPLLRMEGITKSFPGVRALRDVDFELRVGEVHALVGENGAGKSTLVRVLAGALLPDEGSIHIDGIRSAIRDPMDAQRAGVAVIYQEFNLVPFLSARENIFLGREASRLGFVAAGPEREEARMVLARIGAAVDPETRCASMSVGQRQMVEISKALVRQARIVVLDEPTAALTLADTERLFDVIRELKARGLGLIYISHRLEEVFAIADRVTVLRDGQRVATLPVEGLNREKLIEMMVGRRLEGEFPTRHTQAGADRLVVRNLCRTGAVRDVSFVVRRGEVVGLTGLVGAGRTETARLIFGADCADSGSIELDGKTLRIRRPADAIAAGICLLTEDRKSEGLVLGRSVRENFGLPNLDRFSGMGLVRKLRERAELERLGKELDIRMAGPDVPARNLSGGNQQKVVLAKWLERDCEVIMFDEPTRGIDVGAKYEIYLLINRLAAQGKAILMISSELPEVIGMSDRIMVMKQGRVTGEVPGGPLATQEQIMGLAVG